MESNMTWLLFDHKNKPGNRYLTIQLNGLRIADVFPDAGMYRGKVEPEWVIEQAQLIVDTMNAQAKP
jgi:hypothetical protein